MDLDEARREQAENVLLDNLTLAALRAELREAVEDGIRNAMTQESARAFWSVGIELLQEQATRRTGRFILDGAWFALKRLFWVCAALLAIYMLGGWHLVVTLIKTLAREAS